MEGEPVWTGRLKRELSISELWQDGRNEEQEISKRSRTHLYLGGIMAEVPRLRRESESH